MSSPIDKKEAERRPGQAEQSTGATERPFDTRVLERLPQARDDDPPYRPWWAVDQV